MPVKNALVVDDSKSARIMLQRLLSRMDVQVDAVDSAEAALKFLENQQPDVIFMDHMMPGMDGLEATQLIKANPATAAIPTIMYTSKEGDDYLQEARSHGAHAVLPKPANQEAVMAVMATLDAPAANDEKPTPAAPAPIPLAEVDKLIQRQLKRALTEAKAEIAAGLDSTTQQLQNTQQHSAEQLHQQLQQQLSQQLQAELQPKVLFDKLKPLQQRLAVSVAKQLDERQSERLLLQLQQQQEQLKQLTQQQQQLGEQIKRSMIMAAVAGAVIGASIGVVISLFL